MALLCSAFFGGEPVHINSLYLRKRTRPKDYYTLKDVAGKRYGDKDLYVLIASADIFRGGGVRV